jgi:hypothetical protein
LDVQTTVGVEWCRPSAPFSCSECSCMLEQAQPLSPASPQEHRKLGHPSLTHAFCSCSCPSGIAYSYYQACWWAGCFRKWLRLAGLYCGIIMAVAIAMGPRAAAGVASSGKRVVRRGLGAGRAVPVPSGRALPAHASALCVEPPVAAIKQQHRGHAVLASTHQSSTVSWQATSVSVGSGPGLALGRGRGWRRRRGTDGAIPIDHL